MKINKYTKIISQTAVLTILCYCCSAQAADTTVVNFNTTYQVIDGFGASSANEYGYKSTMPDSIADMLFSTTKGIGLSLERNQMRPYLPWTDELSIMRQAQARGAKVWSSVWTPPAQWKTNDTTINGGYLEAQYYPNYAQYFANYITAMQDSGINLYAVSIQNEPEQNVNYWSCLWTAQDMEDFIPYLYDTLQAHGLGNVKIMASEDDCWELDYAQDILNNPTTDSMLSICAAHDYCYANPTSPFNTTGKPMWETEVSTLDALDSSIANGLMWATTINQFLTKANISAWHWWWLVNHTELNNEGLMDSMDHPAKRMYTMGNFSKFIRPGYIRVSATGGPNGVDFSAYENDTTGAFAIVAINNNSTATPVVIDLNGLSASSVTPWITSGTFNLVPQTEVSVSGSSFAYTLPDSSVTTFVYTGTTTGVNPINIASNNISVYPNPARNEITIAGLNASFKNQIVRVYSTIGQLVYENSISGITRYTLNLSSFAPGMYCVVISGTYGQVVKKIMVAK